MAKALSQRRYAQAVFQIATESGNFDGWSQDLLTLSTALDDDDFLRFMDAPQISSAVKTETLQQTLANVINPPAFNLLLLLGSRGMAKVIPAISEEYTNLVNRHQGIHSGEVSSAVKLDESQQQRIETLLENILDTKVQLSYQVEPDLIGGLIAQIGDRVIDGSVKTRIDGMRRNIIARP